MKLPTDARSRHSGVIESAVTVSPSDDTATALPQLSENRKLLSPPAMSCRSWEGEPEEGLW
ncbi:hypothetical protein [Leifsonia xyli]|uniref:hypothetical protein n=1 Tax=Leifsonia xyli TaxID=1575 RepID=UPI00031BD21F|nr:hypothetical protein [Leifsonia xyli]